MKRFLFPLLVLINITTLAQTTVNVDSYGALGNGRVIADASMTAASPTLTSASAFFTSSDVGKLVSVKGAGASNATLNTTIASIISGTQATLNANASTTVSAALAVYGTDDYTAINNALTSTAAGSVIKGTTGNVYCVSQRVRIPSDKTFTCDTLPNGARASIVPMLDQDGGYIYTDADWQVNQTGLAGVVVTANQSTITVPNGSNFSVGRILWVKSGGLLAQYPDASGQYFHGWIGVITNITGNVITLHNSVKESFTATGLTQFGVTVSGTPKPMENAHLLNWRLDLRCRTQGTGVAYARTKNSSIVGVKVIATPNNTSAGTISQGINVSYSVDIPVTRCYVEGGALSATNSQYAISPSGWNVVVTYCTVRKFSGGIIGGQRDHYTLATIRYNDIDLGGGSGQAANHHGMGMGPIEYNRIRSKPLIASGALVSARYSYTDIQHNDIEYDVRGLTFARAYTVSVSENGDRDINIRNNKIVTLADAGTANVHAIGSWNRTPVYKEPLTNIDISGNDVNGSIKFPLPETDGGIVETFGTNFTIANNFFTNTVNHDAYIELNNATSGSGAVAMTGNVFKSSVGNVSNYTIKTNATPFASLSATGNSKYLTNAANTYTSVAQQYQFGTTTNVTSSGNSVYTSSTTPPAFPSIPLVSGANMFRTQSGQVIRTAEGVLKF